MTPLRSCHLGSAGVSGTETENGLDAVVVDCVGLPTSADAGADDLEVLLAG
jgi:hypothetical protein